MKTKTHPDEASILRESDSYSKRFREAEETIIRWAIKEKLLKSIEKSFRNFEAIIDEMPEEWRRFAITECVYASVFTKPAMVRKLSISVEASELPTDVHKLIAAYKENPWTYRIIAIEKRYPNAIFEVRDLISDEILLFRSESIRKNIDFSNMYLVLAFESGPCFQAMGIVHSYYCFDIEDFKVLAGILVKKKLCIPGDLYSIINQGPIPFLLFDKGGNNKKSYFKNAEVRHIEATIRGIEILGKNLGDTYPVTATDKTILVQPDADGPEKLFTVSWDVAGKKLEISAAAREAWLAAVTYLQEAGIDVPKSPDFDLSFGGAYIISRLFPGSFPLFTKAANEFGEAGEEAGDGGKKEINQTLDKVNLVIKEATDLENRGLPCDLDEIGKRHALSRDAIEGVKAMMMRMRAKYVEQFGINIPGGFDDFVPPPPADRQVFIFGLLDKGPISFVETDDTNNLMFDIMPLWEHVAKKYDSQFDDIEQLPFLLSDAGADYFEVGSLTILSYTFMLLFHYGAKPRSVRDYAVEFLKTFWQIVTLSNEPQSLERFIRKFKKFALEVLIPFEIVAVDVLPDNPRKEDFSIKAGKFFLAWARMPILYGKRK